MALDISSPNHASNQYICPPHISKQKKHTVNDLTQITRMTDGISFFIKKTLSIEYQEKDY
jgi:hypothetical protein